MIKKMNYIYIFLSIFFQSFAVIFGKYASINMQYFNFNNIVSNSYYLGSLICLGLQALFWQLTLRSFPLFFAYMFTSLVYLIILFSSYILFAEKLSIMNLIGALFIIMGLLIMNSKGKKNSA